MSTLETIGIKILTIKKEDKTVGHQVIMSDGCVIDTYKKAMFCSDCFEIEPLDDEQLETVNELIEKQKTLEKVGELLNTL